jgi:CheY-like chemotaxis protein
MPNDRPLVAIVNKDATFVQLLDTLLRNEGYDTLLVEAGDIAHPTLKQQRPHVILLDIDIDAPAASWRVVDLLLLDPDTAQKPLIICSLANQTLAERADKLVAAGCTIVENRF